MGIYIQRWGDSQNTSYGDIHRLSNGSYHLIPLNANINFLMYPGIILKIFLLYIILHVFDQNSLYFVYNYNYCFRYDYFDLCTDVKTYPRPRFASEFGFQSYPSFPSLQKVSGPSVRPHLHGKCINYYCCSYLLSLFVVVVCRTGIMIHH